MLSLRILFVDGPLMRRSKVKGVNLQRMAKRCGGMISYSQAEPARELTQPRKHLLAEPCTVTLLSPSHH